MNLDRFKTKMHIVISRKAPCMITWLLVLPAGWDQCHLRSGLGLNQVSNKKPCKFVCNDPIVLGVRPVTELWSAAKCIITEKIKKFTRECYSQSVILFATLTYQVFFSWVSLAPQWTLMPYILPDSSGCQLHVESRVAQYQNWFFSSISLTQSALNVEQVVD